MYLTKDEEKMYDGEYGKLYEWAMRFLAAYGDGLEAERLVKISAACFDYYRTLEWVLPPELYDEFFKSRMAVPVYTNVHPDIECWKEIGMSEKAYQNAKSIEMKYANMNVFLTGSCAAYLIGWAPAFGSHVASIESALYVYLNSVLGARTHRESYPGIFAVALTGKTPYTGLHTDEGRRGNLLVKVKTELNDTMQYNALGYHVGAFVTDWDRPVFTGISGDVGTDDLKSLGAALQLQGSVGLYHIVNVTPEAPTIEYAFGGDEPKETITVGKREIKGACEKLSTGGEEKLIT